MGASNAVDNRVENWWQKNAMIVKSMYHVPDIEMDSEPFIMNQFLKGIRRQWSYERRTNVLTMARGSPVIATALILMMIASTCFVAPAQADQSVLDEIEVLHTAVNPDNNKTYHLLSASSWEDAAFKARSLDGYLTTIDNAEEKPGCSIPLRVLTIKADTYGLD